MSEVYVPSEVVVQQTPNSSNFPVNPDQGEEPKPIRPPIVYRDGR